LEHFDQKDPVNCHNMCDVCVKGEVMVEEDVTAYALDILRLTEDLTGNGTANVSKTVVQGVYRGSNARDIIARGFASKPLFGAGKGIPTDRVARIFDHLISENALQYVSVAKGTWSSTYLQVRRTLTQSGLFYL
jgi:superfamily II DNA helicase RecQ